MMDFLDGTGRAAAVANYVAAAAEADRATKRRKAGDAASISRAREAEDRRILAGRLAGFVRD